MKKINHHIIDYTTIQKDKNFDTELINEDLLFYFADSKAEIAALYGGFRNTSVYVYHQKTEYVLRIYTNKKKQANYENKLKEVIKAEWEFVDYLKKNGVPVPSLIPNRNQEIISKHKNNYIVLMNYINGKDARFDLNEKKFENMGKLMAKMHNCAQKYPKEKTNIFTTKNPFIYISEKIKPDTPNLHNTLLEILKDYEVNETKINELPKHIIHGDLIFSNILFKKDNIAGVLDFDNMHKGTFIKELASFIISTFDHHKLYEMRLSFIESFMNAYTSTRPLTKLEKDLFLLYLKVSKLGIQRMLTKYRPGLVEQYLIETKEAISFIESRFL